MVHSCSRTQVTGLLTCACVLPAACACCFAACGQVVGQRLAATFLSVTGCQWEIKACVSHATAGCAIHSSCTHFQTPVGTTCRQAWCLNALAHICIYVRGRQVKFSHTAHQLIDDVERPAVGDVSLPSHGDATRGYVPKDMCVRMETSFVDLTYETNAVREQMHTVV